MQNLKKLLKSKEPTIRKLVKKISDVASVVKKDTIIGARYGKFKLKELDVERQKAIKIYAIGKKTFGLYQRGKVKDKFTVNLCKQLEILEKIAQRYNISAKKEGKKIKFKKT